MELPQISAYATQCSNYDLGTVTTSGLMNSGTFTTALTPVPFQITSTPDNPMPSTNRRIVQIFIADADESVPLEKSILFQDEKPHLTDLTDQELFFEIDIKNILARHNQYRVTLVDKEASEGKSKDVLLEPAKVRDLKMTVVNVATF